MILNQIIFIGKGLLLTVGLSIGGLIISLVLGLIVAILFYKDYGRFIIKAYIGIMRGTPLLLQLSFFYFVIPNIFDIRPDIITAGILTLGINGAAYCAEVFRGGINTVHKGQFEAAQTLQIPEWLMWKDIIMPQVFRNVFPTLVNEFVGLLKSTSLISTLGGMDIMRRSQLISAEQFIYFTPICIAAVYYFVIVLIIQHIGKKIEKRISYA